MTRVTRYLILALVVFPSLVQAKEVRTGQRLFHLERNKNANIVVYDAILDEDGSLAEKDPVSVYWIKAAEDSRIENLKGIERSLAYGFKIKEREGDRLTLKMKADVGRPVIVDRHDDGYLAFIEIEGTNCILDKIYVFADESGIMPKVIYVEIFGRDPESDEERYEKLEQD